MPLPKDCLLCEGHLSTEALPTIGRAVAYCRPCDNFTRHEFAPCPALPPAAACPECHSLNGTITAKNLRHRDHTQPEVQFRCWDCGKWLDLKGCDASKIVVGILTSLVPKANTGGKPWMN